MLIVALKQGKQTMLNPPRMHVDEDDDRRESRGSSTSDRRPRKELALPHKCRRLGRSLERSSYENQVRVCWFRQSRLRHAEQTSIEPRYLTVGVVL